MDDEQDDEVEEAPQPTALIVGLGDERRRDAGVGIVVARALERERLPDGTEVLVSSTGPLGAVAELSAHSQAVIITAADMRAAPGTVRCYTLEGLEEDLVLPVGAAQGLSLTDALELGEMLGDLPQVRVVAIQPEDVGPGRSLSAAVEGAVRRAAVEVLGVLAEG